MKTILQDDAAAHAVLAQAQAAQAAQLDSNPVRSLSEAGHAVLRQAQAAKVAALDFEGEGVVIPVPELGILAA